MTKTCKHHGELPENEIHQGIYKGKKYWQCKICKRERLRKRYHEKVLKDEELLAQKREKDRLYWAENKDKIKKRRIKNNDSETRRAAYKRMQPFYNRKCKDKQQKYRDELHPSYIKKLIRGDKGTKNYKPIKEIPSSFIDLKATLVTFKRKVNQKYLQEKTGRYNDKTNK